MALKKTEIKKIDSLIKKLMKCGEINTAWHHLSFKAIYDAAQWINTNADFILNIPDYDKYSVDIQGFCKKYKIW